MFSAWSKRARNVETHSTFRSLDYGARVGAAKLGRPPIGLFSVASTAVEREYRSSRSRPSQPIEMFNRVRRDLGPRRDFGTKQWFRSTTGTDSYLQIAFVLVWSVSRTEFSE